MNPNERAEMYGLLAKLFYQPTEDGLPAADTGSALRRLAELSKAAGLPALPDEVLGLSSEDIRREYFRTFTHAISKDCPPYETEYGEAHIFMQTQDLGDLQGFYRAFGLGLNALAHERPDHLSFELEFLGFLAAKEAWLKEGEGADVTREATQMFLRDHVSRWVPAFGSRLKIRAAGRLFGSLADVLKAWIDRDVRDRGIEDASLRTLDLRPPTYHPDSSDCSTCGIGDIPETFFNQGAKP